MGDMKTSGVSPACETLVRAQTWAIGGSFLCNPGVIGIACAVAAPGQRY